MLIAKDMMTAKVKTLESSNSIQEAIHFFAETKVSSVPVVTTGTHEALGLLTEMSLVRALVLHQLQPDKFKKLQHCLDLMEKVVFVNESDPMAKVLAAMINSPAKRVIVQNNAGINVGIISPKDLLRSLTGEKGLGAKNDSKKPEEKGPEKAAAAAAGEKPASDKAADKKTEEKKTA